MAREILFKAKRIENGEWVEGYYQKRYDEMERERHYIFWCKSNIVWEYAEIDPDTICQYTGLTDKNGNRIWENDIVKRVDRRNGLYVSREQPKMNCKVVWTYKHGYDTEPSCGYFDTKNAMECEVIGNIFDNPELLNK